MGPRRPTCPIPLAPRLRRRWTTPRTPITPPMRTWSRSSTRTRPTPRTTSGRSIRSSRRGCATWSSTSTWNPGSGKSIRFDLGTPAGLDCVDVQAVGLPHPAAYYDPDNATAARQKVVDDLQPLPRAPARAARLPRLRRRRGRTLPGGDHRSRHRPTIRPPASPGRSAATTRLCSTTRSASTSRRRSEGSGFTSSSMPSARCSRARPTTAAEGTASSARTSCAIRASPARSSATFATTRRSTGRPARVASTAAATTTSIPSPGPGLVSGDALEHLQLAVPLRGRHLRARQRRAEDSDQGTEAHLRPDAEVQAAGRRGRGRVRLPGRPRPLPLLRPALQAQAPRQWAPQAEGGRHRRGRKRGPKPRTQEIQGHRPPARRALSPTGK